jgi:hypothetical protein
MWMLSTVTARVPFLQDHHSPISRCCRQPTTPLSAGHGVHQNDINFLSSCGREVQKYGCCGPATIRLQVVSASFLTNFDHSLELKQLEYTFSWLLLQDKKAASQYEEKV